MQYQLDEPCSCGSGDLFRDCHGPILCSPPKKRVDVAQARYAQAWSQNADGYRAQGLYDRLAAEVTECHAIRKVFDIGCGLGHGLEALRSVLPGEKGLILGVDENPDCVAGAVKRLGLPMVPAAHKRLRPKLQLSGRFEIEIRKGGIPAPDRVSIVNADVLLDDAVFDSWLAKQAPFDAVTMWFMGVHKGRGMTKINAELGITSDRAHRELLERKQVQFASRLLRPGGVLHLVNRIVSTTIDSYLITLEEQAAQMLVGSPLHFVSLKVHPYTELDVKGSIRVSQPGIDVNGLPLFATSLLARKNDVVS